MCGQCGFASRDLTTPIFPDFHPASAGLVVMGDDLGAECTHRPQALAPSDGGGTVESEVCWLD